MPLIEYRKRVLDRGNSRCKEPEVEKGWVCSGTEGKPAVGMVRIKR